jgi:urease accessory protein
MASPLSLAGAPIDAESARVRTWRAQLALEFECRAARTVLSARHHDGPLVIQKPLYPEGAEVCHAIIVHPPAGIAGGDELEITARLEKKAHALMTTPGATKWYRSAGPRAYQHIRFSVDSGACVEWLPQETIVFDGALAELRTNVQLFGDGCYIGWEILCLGRAGAGECFTKGEYRARTVIERDGKSIWLERAQLQGGSPALASPVVMAGQSVAGTFIAASSRFEDGLLELCRDARPLTGSGAVTAMPGLLVGRYLGASSEAVKNYFAQLWRVLRPVLAGRPAAEPRIWRT